LKAELEKVAAGAPTVAERRTDPGEITTRTATDPAATTAADATRRSAVAGNGHLGEATRRTESDEEVTRRTSAAGNGAGPAAPEATVKAATVQAAAPASRGRNALGILKRAGIVLAIALVANEWLALRAAGDLETRLSSYRRSDASRVWQQYRGLRARSLLGVGAWSVAGPLVKWHVAAADELTEDYRSDTPTIRERGWQQAAALLRRAAAIAPGDSKVRARLRYAEGQLARINGEALLERNQVAAARARFNEAQRSFEEAARLRGRWPDPYLGLARVNAIAFADVDQTEDALRKAERAGHRSGDREVALMADAYRLRAERMMAAVPGLPEEPRYLQRVRADCWRALELYDQVPAYAQVSRSIRRVHALLERLDAREHPVSPVPGLDDGPVGDSASADAAESSASLE
jgi:hypothetical protein